MVGHVEQEDLRGARSAGWSRRAARPPASRGRGTCRSRCRSVPSRRSTVATSCAPARGRDRPAPAARDARARRRSCSSSGRRRRSTPSRMSTAMRRAARPGTSQPAKPCGDELIGASSAHEPTRITLPAHGNWTGTSRSFRRARWAVRRPRMFPSAGCGITPTGRAARDRRPTARRGCRPATAAAARRRRIPPPISRASSCSAAMRFSVAGWVENRLSMRAPGQRVDDEHVRGRRIALGARRSRSACAAVRDLGERRGERHPAGRRSRRPGGRPRIRACG